MRFDKLTGVALFSVSVVVSLVACGTPDVTEARGNTTSAIAGSSPNDKTAFDFFVGKGLTPTQAAAVVGNLDQESSMNPNAKQLPSGPGRGVAQWSLNDRWAQENAFAQQNGGDMWDLQTQLDFVWHELSTNAHFGLAQLQAATTLSSAVEIFQDKYEICGKCNAGSRVTFAQTALSSFGDDAPAASPSDGTTPSDTTGTPTDTSATNSDGSPVFDNTPTSTASNNTSASNDNTGVDAGGGGGSPSGDDDDDSQGSCVADGVVGSCVSTSECGAQGGFSTSGLCPGSNNIQCCTFDF